jgi:hypothetical protein
MAGSSGQIFSANWVAGTGHLGGDGKLVKSENVVASNPDPDLFDQFVEKVCIHHRIEVTPKNLAAVREDLIKNGNASPVDPGK